MAESNKTLSGRTVSSRKYIELYGMTGRFDLPNKPVKVRYFSTIASSTDKRSDSFALLKELKPMRERVRASEIKDLASLLQRNLDDYRVAYELIPYLLKERPEIAFFPAILGVLIPNDFLGKEVITSYPAPSESVGANGNIITSYGEKWKLERFKIGEEVTNLGILSIDIKDIEVVVLDGQHRANAFRVASGAFSEKDSSVYPAFYKDLLGQEEISADLPITLIWFENENSQFDPRYVSRRLFVDVNNSAQRVSKSRKILLNDYETSSLITRFFYSAIAENKSFVLDNFSLFHSEFDKDSDIAISSNNVLAITNPEFIHDIVSWTTLGSRAYNDLAKYSSRDGFKSNTSEFSDIFNSEKFTLNDIDPYEEFLNARIVVIKDATKINVFESEYNQHLHPVLYNVFNKFNLFQKHYKACLLIGDWYKDGMNTYQRTVWEEVFSGGEGLYYTFKNKDIKDKANNALKNYLTAIDEIEKKFKQERAKFFGGLNEKEINSAFESATTKAFQVGLFMALDYFKEGKCFIDAYEEFITRLNTIPESSWIVILNDIRQELIGSVDPKLWPSYKNLILRVIQKPDCMYYNKDNYNISPDGLIFSFNLKKSFNGWWETQDDLTESDLNLNSVDKETIAKWAKNSEEQVNELLGKANIQPIPGANIIELATTHIHNEIKSINPDAV
jgi:hypothetical protein